MKNFLRTMLVIFGILSVVTVSGLLLLIAGKITLGTLAIGLSYILTHRVIRIIIIATLSIYGLCSVISIAFSGVITSDLKGGIILPLKVGEVHISSQTFESIVTNVAKKYAGVKTAKVNIKIKETGINVDLFAYVLQDTVISDITSKLQEDIKATVLKQTTVAVETVNVKIKGVYTLNENKQA
ncbi:MAG: alkaline shock response membrane anchor protein AmaP [Clostridia bacterium]|nr:alkaline shock response membrane anchor protein AmaP [Clostridia bacterium]